jgi:hypothetical protein
MDLFRCESIVLRSYWVLVVMDQFTRRLVGVDVHLGAVKWRRPLPRLHPTLERAPRDRADSRAERAQRIFKAADQILKAGTDPEARS